MRYRIRFQLLRDTPVMDGYRPNWVSACKPDQNCARMIDIEGDQAILDPLFPDQWPSLGVGDNIDAYEGARQTVHAIITAVIE